MKYSYLTPKKYVFGLLLLMAVFVPAIATPDSAVAVSGKDWKAGQIVDDSIFYKGNDLSSTEIQKFLNKKVPSCETNHAETSSPNDPDRPYICLKAYYENPINHKNNLDGKPKPSGALSAAQLIRRASDDYNVSAKVLIVLLEKEQSLVTDTWPWTIQYRSAMGYGCPDTAACDSEYYGFYNQIRNAARQIKIYKDNPTSYRHRAGQNNSVLYNPQSSCGSSTVYIKTNATAGLYNYTPYQPNRAALDNLYGSGNSCSAYGNRNFWRIYNDWFGSTILRSGKPIKGDWNGDGKDTIGIRRGNVYYLYNDTSGNAATVVGFGKTTDKVIVGDWNRDGKDGIGLKRGDRYYFDYNNDGKLDKYIGFGKASDSVIVGDWNGNGQDGIGLKRGNHYFLDYQSDARVDIHTVFGKSTDGTIVGDWNGNNKDTIGLKRGDRYYFDYDNDGRMNDYIGFGKASDAPLAGNWDNSGRDSIALKRGSNYYFDYDSDGKTNLYFVYGKSTDNALSANWGGTGMSGIGLQRNSNYYFDYDNDGRQNAFFYAN